ncbi:MAG: ABC transporter permease [Treponema sp.]|nr:ABC transporter permease [Treponema sp.]
MNILLGMIPSILMIVAPIMITAAGGMVSERSGVTNIALEGLMGFGAFSAAAFQVLTESWLPGSEWWALLAGGIVGMVFSSIHAYAAISLNANQTVSGTGINLLATGATIFFSQVLFSADRTTPFRMGMRPGIFGIYPTAWVAIAVMAIIWFVFYKLPFGLRLRACGEHPDAAASVGINVRGIRYFAVLASGFLAGLAGGCLVLTQTIQYTSNTINGTGFISLAAVSFGRWNPLGVSGASLLFGSAVAFAIYVVNIPALGEVLPAEFFNLLPYVITLLALVIFSGKNYAPVANGKPYVNSAS